MPWFEPVAILLAGVGAGTINTIVGSGTLITFPTLLFFGYPPILANVSNTLGQVAGGASGSWGYRRELAGHGEAVRRLLPLSLAGSVLGSALLLVLPAKAFATIVPVLIVLALCLVVFGPRIQRAAAHRHTDASGGWRTPALLGGTFFAGVYGGYFGAAQGVLLVGLFSLVTSYPLQRANAYKNILATAVNLVAAAVFLLFARDQIDWVVAALVAVGATAGGVIGAHVGRRLPPQVLRVVIVTVGVLAIVKMVAFP